MLDLYISVATSPFLWIAAVFAFVAMVLQSVGPLDPARLPRRLPGDPQRAALIVFGAVLVIAALLGLGVLIAELFPLLRSVPRPTEDPDLIRYHAALIVALFAAIGGLFTLVFALIRAFATERQTRTAEDQRKHNELVLVNQRIQGALNRLGARKPVSRIGRTVFHKTEQGREGHFEWQDGPIDRKGMEDVAAQPWQSFEWEEPDRQTRLAAIGEFDAIAREHPERRRAINEHLASFLRANASTAVDQPGVHGTEQWNVARSPTCPADIQAAIQLIGRSQDPADVAHLDLRRLNLQGVELPRAHLARTQLGESRLEATDLRAARLAGADLTGAYLREVRVDASTSFIPVSLRGAGLQAVDLAPVATNPADLSRLLAETFGDASVSLPEGVARPGPWPDENLGLNFEFFWQAWQQEVGNPPDGG